MKEAQVDEIVDSSHRIKGKIVKLDESGYGFLVSKDLPYTRIYFYWSALLPGERNFSKLHIGDVLEFEANEYIDKETNENKGYRAYKIKVVS